MGLWTMELDKSARSQAASSHDEKLVDEDSGLKNRGNKEKG
jgi:hypothetical protein